MRKCFTDQQIIGFLKEAETGVPVEELCRKHGVSDEVYYGWRSRFGGLQINEAKRLRELEAENVKLKKLLADLPPTEFALRHCRCSGDGETREVVNPCNLGLYELPTDSTKAGRSQ